MFFNAASIPLGGTTELIFNLGDSADPANYTNVRFTDTLPSGIIVATPNGVFNNCGGTVTAAAGSSTITLAGVTLAANAFCTVRVTVLATSAGVKANTVILRSDQGDSPPDTDNMTVTKGDTTVATTASPNPSVFGQLVTFTATVSSGLAIPIPTGTVTFKDGAITLGTATLDGNGRATFTTTALEVGSHTITAVYAGDANFNGSTSAPLAQDIARARTVAAIRRFLGARNDLLLSNNPNSGRQIDRLEQAQSNGSNQGTGFTDVAGLPGTAVSSRPIAGFYGRDTVAGRMSLGERVLGAGTETGGSRACVGRAVPRPSTSRTRRMAQHACRSRPASGR